MQAEVVARSASGRLIRFDGDVQTLLRVHGQVPLPPYIGRSPQKADSKRYQTIYARKPGSVAAPTAGMHFTRQVFTRLKEKQIDVCRITLHVGPGTFRTIKTEDITQHTIDPEYYSCSAAVWRKITRAPRVIAAGTTTTRALETIAARDQLSGSTDLFIYPGYRFQIVKGMITNFHLPKSSLLLLVSAFAGYDAIRSAYQHAVKKGYRFYSYGDATLILRDILILCRDFSGSVLRIHL
jgi:S-adenosylmethionine:tRNA ribosyltransferase-isomerase